MDQYDIKIINEERDFLNLREDWNMLIQNDSQSTVFQLWEWNYYVYSYAQKDTELTILAFYTKESHRLVAIAPLLITSQKPFLLPVRVIEFIGGRYLDYRNFIIEDEYRDGIHTAILNWLLDHKLKWDIVDLNHICCDSEEENNDVFGFTGKFNKIPVKIQIENKAPFLPLNDHKTVSELIGQGSFWNYLKRKMRKVQKDFDCKLKIIQNEEELERYFPSFIRINKERSKDKLQRGVFSSSEIEEMIYTISKQLLRAGFLKLYVVELDGVIAAALLNLNFKDKEYFYQSGFDVSYRKYSLGYVIHYYAIESSMANGNSEYDFLIGDEPYKWQWTKMYRSIKRIQVIRSVSKYNMLYLVGSIKKYVYNNNILKKAYFKVFR
jgi:CelD/BcsL family acetyltransferase involved in cellulose biosynthesis